MNAQAIREQFEHAAAHEPRICVMLMPRAKLTLRRALDSEKDLVLRGKIARARLFVSLAVCELEALGAALAGDGEAARLRAQLAAHRARLIARAQILIPALCG